MDHFYLNEILNHLPCYTLSGIARESGIPRTTLIRIYSGANKKLHAKTFTRLLQFYCHVVTDQNNVTTTSKMQ